MLFYSRGYSAARGLFRGETFVLSLFALLGMMVMIAAAASSRSTSASSSSACRSIAMVRDVPDLEPGDRGGDEILRARGAGVGILLYGMSMIYGATGSLDIVDVAQSARGRAGRPDDPDLRARVRRLRCRVQAGRGPYHMWVPDVYDGAPTPSLC
jgi:NADH-quinone oxidoreductase subunit N